MHILHVNKFFFERGGTERYFFSVSRALETRGHTVSHFAMRHPDNAESPFAAFFVSQKDYAGKGTRFEDIPAGLSFIRSGEAVVFTAGFPFGVAGTTSLIKAVVIDGPAGA